MPPVSLAAAEADAKAAAWQPWALEGKTALVFRTGSGMTGLRLAIALHQKGVHVLLTAPSKRASEILLLAFDMTLRSIEEVKAQQAPPPSWDDSPPVTCRPRPSVDTVLVDPSDVSSIRLFLDGFKQNHN